MSTVFTDDFNRADSSTLGNNWVESGGSWEIVSNKLRCTSAGDLLTNTTAIGSADYECEVIVANAVTGNDGPAGRASDTNNFYMCLQGSTTFSLWKKVAGSYINLGSASVGSAVNVTLKLSMQGTAIKGYWNGVETLSVTDSALGAEGDFGLRPGDSNKDYDDYAVYDFGAAPAAPARLLTLLGVGS